VLELRYPRRDVDQEPPQPLVEAIHQLVRAQSDAETLTAVYTVFKPALIAAYGEYLRRTDPVDDAPTVYLLERLIREKQAQVAEGEAWLRVLPEQENTAAWTEWLQNGLAEAGGLLGGDAGVDAGRGAFASRPASGSDVRPGYVRPLRFARDPRFLPANIHMPNRWYDAAKPLEIQVWLAINHINEIWAAEVPLMLAWELAEMPWAFYLDIGRWAWDESRHSLMGERRLLAWGFEIGTDVPLVADHYHSVATERPEVILALLNGFETNGPAWKKGLKATFEAIGDRESAQDCDFDWADESIHLSYGFKWLRHLVGDEAEVERLKREAMAKWSEWREDAKNQPLGDYEPFWSRITAKIRALEEAAP
jgi:uncharacterized ferritin-like protein (DUF455 family)